MLSAVTVVRCCLSKKRLPFSARSSLRLFSERTYGSGVLVRCGCGVREVPPARHDGRGMALQQCWVSTSAPKMVRVASVAPAAASGGGGAAPSPPAVTCPAPPPPPAACAAPGRQSPPPPPPPNQFPWKYVVGALAVGSLSGVWYYQNLDEKDEPKKQDEIPSKQRSVRRVPASITELPEHVQYLLVGGGTASFAAFRAIKSNDPKAQVLVISEEDVLPYMRPPLSKEIWRDPELAKSDTDQLTFRQWNGNRRSLFYESSGFYTDVSQLKESENGGVAVARGYSVRRVDPRSHTAVVSAPGQEERTVQYNKCLIATGVRPDSVPVLAGAEEGVRARTVLLRTVRDAERLWRALEREGARAVAIVGGGFLGTEMACALAQRLQGTGKEVRQIFREPGNMAHVLPQYLSQWAMTRVEEQGALVQPSTEIKRAYMKNDRVALHLSTGETVEADLVVVGAGSTPNTELAAASRLELHPELGGLLVNAELAARTDLYAAGDVACFYDEQLGRRRVEHHDHAVVSGRLAGENMAGASPPRHYHHQSMFWSDLGPELGYEAIGIIDSSLPTVGVFLDAATEAGADLSAADAKRAAVAVDSAGVEHVQLQPEPIEPHLAAKKSVERDYSRGVVFYLREERVVGVLLWNLFNRMHLARQVLSQGEFEDLNEVAKLFSLHEE